MFNKLVLLIVNVSLGCLTALGPAMAQAVSQDISTVQTKTRQAIEKEVKAQQQADQWSREKEQLISEIRQEKAQLDWTRYQIKKYTAYIKREKEKIRELKRRNVEMRSLRRNLEPFLDQLIAGLEAFIASDLRFLSNERMERLQFLRDSVNDYHLSMSQKLRRVLEALLVEAEYGHSIEAEPAAIHVQGRAIEAEILRIGRIAVFFRSMNGKSVGRWNPPSDSWEYIDPDFSRPIGDTIEMAKQQKSVELVDLPIGPVGGMKK